MRKRFEQILHQRKYTSDITGHIEAVITKKLKIRVKKKQTQQP